MSTTLLFKICLSSPLSSAKQQPCCWSKKLLKLKTVVSEMAAAMVDTADED
jgi:hypothetical protein